MEILKKLIFSPNTKPRLESPAAAQFPQSTPSLLDKCVSEDPTPTPADLGKNSTVMKIPSSVPLTPQSSSLTISPTCHDNKALERPLHAYDTLLHFAAVELEGRLQKN